MGIIGRLACRISGHPAAYISRDWLQSIQSLASPDQPSRGGDIAYPEGRTLPAALGPEACITLRAARVPSGGSLICCAGERSKQFLARWLHLSPTAAGHRPARADPS